MGSSTSKLKKKLAKGDEYSALNLFDTNKDLQKKFNPNASYGDNYNHDTPLHLASRHTMPRALRMFLYEYGGNPNKKNTNNESSLHCACRLKNERNAKSLSAHEQCVNMLVEWKGSRLGDGTHDQLDIAAQDKFGNTALHYAAQSGFMSCVKQLVGLGAPLFTENDNRQTPCELAEKASMTEIAQYLESKMVFYENEDADHSSPIDSVPIIQEDNYQGLRPQELQDAKDTLIVETSDMLRVPLFTAEVLLRHHEWDKEVLLEAWILDPVCCCEQSGIVPPSNLNNINDAGGDHELDILKTSTSRKDFTPSTCEICFDNIVDARESLSMVCEHWFCQSCWKDYLNLKIKEGDAHNITCPAVDCNILVPVEFIEKSVSSNMARRYLQFDIKAFVASNPRIVWCPHPGCGIAIHNPERNRSASVTSRSSLHSTSLQYQTLAAHCNNGHSFCWHCQMEPHDPASCDDYRCWLEKIIEMKNEEFKDVTTKSEVAANTFWMLSNSKKCPNCKSPIEKNEGCNHMRCSKCRHDFCWVCMEPWKHHNSTTGGFFRCTRYEIVEKVDEKHQSEVTDASGKHKALQELNRFVHYYTRYENHKHSLELEEPLLHKAKQKMSQLVKSHSSQSTSQLSAVTPTNTMSRLAAARFIDEAITVLIKARRMLQFCYIYGYFLEGNNMKQMVFELLQTELEEKTEYLSEIVARPYLRTPKAQIIKITKQVSDKTEEFYKSIANGLLPQDLPMSEDSTHRSYAPWAIEERGGAAGSSWLSDSDDSVEEPSQQGICAAANCNKLKLRHSGATGLHHDYCSLNCLKSDYVSRTKRKAKHHNKEQQIDLLQALEMSRLQLLQDMDSLNTGSSSDVSVDDEVSLRKQLGLRATELPADPILEHVLRLSESVYAEEQDEDLTLALQMSLQTADVQTQMMRDRTENRKQRAHSHTESISNSSMPGGLDTTPSDNVDTLPSLGATAASSPPVDVYRSRLAELDNAIAELLDSPVVRDHESLRRTESERRGMGSVAVGRNITNLQRPIRRSRSERGSEPRKPSSDV